MGLFNKFKEPIFLKENSNAEEQIEKLKELEPLLNSEGKTIISQDIKYLKYGIAGEKNIAFELRNSHMPMYILHDIYLDDGDLSAQIDYLVFTNKLCFVVECKNLYGNIEVNSAGDFIRTIEFRGRKKKEGIYSPITQNQRHLELMKRIKVDIKDNIMIKFIANRYFEKFNIPIVVLANPKTVLNVKFAKKDIKEKVIRADQLVKYIKDMNDRSKELAASDKTTLEWAQSYLALHKEVVKDYTGKYDQYKISTNKQDIFHQTISSFKESNKVVKESSNSNELICKELKKYRLDKSREEGVKAYYVFTNKVMEELLEKQPKKTEDILGIKGFGKVKTEKYGEYILGIFNKYTY